jgi:hypothetical protein
LRIKGFTTHGVKKGVLIKSLSVANLRLQTKLWGASHESVFIGKGVIPSRQLAVEVKLDLRKLPLSSRFFEPPVLWNWEPTGERDLTLWLNPGLLPFPLLRLAIWDGTDHPSFVTVESPLTASDTLSCRKPTCTSPLVRWLWKNNRIGVNFKRDNTV